MALLRPVRKLFQYIHLGGVRHYEHSVPIRERQPNKFHNGLYDGERVVPEPPQTLTTFTESAEDFVHVEKLLPLKTVPEPPQHDHYPTPSGWVPPTAQSKNLPYYMKRTRFHNFPLYIETFAGGNRKMTLLKFIEGDIWTMESELRQYLEKVTGKKMYTQVDEVCRKIRVRGEHLAIVTEFCLYKGF